MFYDIHIKAFVQFVSKYYFILFLCIKFILWLPCQISVKLNNWIYISKEFFFCLFSRSAKEKTVTGHINLQI